MRVNMPNVQLPPKEKSVPALLLSSFVVGWAFVLAALANFGITQEFPRGQFWTQNKHNYDTVKQFIIGNMFALTGQNADINDVLTDVPLSQFSSAAGLAQVWLAFGSIFLVVSALTAFLPLAARKYPEVSKGVNVMVGITAFTGLFTFIGCVSFFALGGGFTYSYECTFVGTTPVCGYFDGDDLYPISYCTTAFLASGICNLFPVDVAQTAFFAIYALPQYAATCVSLTLVGVILVLVAAGFMVYAARRDNQGPKERLHSGSGGVGAEDAPMAEA